MWSNRGHTPPPQTVSLSPHLLPQMLTLRNTTALQHVLLFKLWWEESCRKKVLTVEEGRVKLRPRISCIAPLMPGQWHRLPLDLNWLLNTIRLYQNLLGKKKGTVRRRSEHICQRINKEAKGIYVGREHMEEEQGRL